MLAQVYTAVPNDVITAARWNNEFGNIYNNGTQIAFPVTTAVSFAGFTLTLDAAGATALSSTSSQGFNLTIGTKSGTPNTTGKSVNIVANTFTDTATAGSGTATSFAASSFQQPTVAAQNTLVTVTDAATVYVSAAPANGTNVTITNPWAIWVDSGNVRFDGNLQVTGTVTGVPLGGVLPFGHIGGLLCSQSTVDATNDFDVSSGEAIDLSKSAANRRLMSLTSTLTKRTDAAWAVGSGNGGLDTGAVGDNPYFIWLIYRSDTGVTDALCSLSSTAPTMPANYDHKRLIGYTLRAGGTQVAWFVYDAGGGAIDFAWSSPTLDVNLANTLTTSRRTDALKVPLSFSVIAHINAVIDDASGAVHHAWIYNPDQADLAPSLTAAPLLNISVISTGSEAQPQQMFIRTSATGTIAARCDLATMDSYAVSTLGFTWARKN